MKEKQLTECLQAVSGWMHGGKDGKPWLEDYTVKKASWTSFCSHAKKTIMTVSEVCSGQPQVTALEKARVSHRIHRPLLYKEVGLQTTRCRPFVRNILLVSFDM